MSPYQVRPGSRRVDRQLERLLHQDRRVYERVREEIRALGSSPRPPDCIKLAGEDNLYRIRIGDWRVLYRIDDVLQEVVVVKVARRNEQTYR